MIMKDGAIVNEPIIGELVAEPSPSNQQIALLAAAISCKRDEHITTILATAADFLDWLNED